MTLKNPCLPHGEIAVSLPDPWKYRLRGSVYMRPSESDIEQLTRLIAQPGAQVIVNRVGKDGILRMIAFAKRTEQCPADGIALILCAAMPRVTAEDDDAANRRFEADFARDVGGRIFEHFARVLA